MYKLSEATSFFQDCVLQSGHTPAGLPAMDCPDGMRVFQAEDVREPILGQEPVYYTERNGEQLKIIFFSPFPDYPEPESAPALPLIIYVQGSGFHRQNLMMNMSHISAFAARGFAVAFVELTPSEVEPFPAAVIDLKAAVRAVKASADKLHIDPGKIILWGDSSGGALSTFAGITGDDSPCTSEYPEYSSAVRAVIDYYGFTDSVQIRPEESVFDLHSPDGLLGCLIGGRAVAGNEALLEATNPLRYIQKGKRIPPFLIMHGDMDDVIPFSQSVLLYTALRDAGSPVEFYKVPGAGHSTPEFWTGEIFDLIESFIRKHI